MSQIEEMMPVFLGKGLILRIYVDHAKPIDAEGHSWSKATYDGADDSPVVTIPAHWHRNHDEIMEVIEGCMTWIIDGKTFNMSAEDGPLTIHRGQVHSFSTIKGVKLVATERSSPGGDFKALFFQDAFRAGFPGFWLTLRSAYDGDIYFTLPIGLKTADYVFTMIVGFLAKLFVPAAPAHLKKKE